MPDADATQPDEVAVLRAKLLEDFAPLPVFAKAIGKEIRTVQRLIAGKKLPYVQIAGTRYIPVTRAREMLLLSVTTREAD